MNKSARVLVLVLAEDEKHQRFIYCYLRQRQFGSHEIRFDIAPKGSGSAEQWVREHYAEKAKQYRTRPAQTRLLVAIDADTIEVQQRERQLQEALEQAQMERRSERDQIVHLIPKRNIETWFRCLNGIDANEQTDYKNRQDVVVSALIKPAAVAFLEGSRNAEIPKHWVQSLCIAVLEIQRLS